MNIIKVGIVILVFNDSDYVVTCVESIRKYSKKYPYQIFIVDNCSTNNNQTILKALYQNSLDVRLIFTCKNGGYSYGNNLGVKEAIKENCTHVVIANPDTYVLNDAVGILVESLIRNPEAAVAGPFLKQPNNLGQVKRVPLNFYNSFYSRIPFSMCPLYPKKRQHHLPWNGQSIKFKGMVAGCFWCIAVKDLEKIGFLDEDFFAYYEEDVLAYKLAEIGKLSLINVNARVYHNHTAIMKKTGAAFIFFHARLSEYLLLCKYAKIRGIKKKIIYYMFLSSYYFQGIRDKGFREKYPELKMKFDMVNKGEYHVNMS